MQRPDMQPMSGGWTLDHDTPAGKLYTVRLPLLLAAPSWDCLGIVMAAPELGGMRGILDCVVRWLQTL